MSEELATVIIACTAIVCLAGVLILRPVSRRLGSFLEALTESKLRPSTEPEMARLREVLTSLDGRLGQIEERQDFAEAMLTAAEPRPLHPAFHAQERN
jgi:hypothetical protein